MKTLYSALVLLCFALPPVAASAGFLDSLRGGDAKQQPVFLPPDQAFALSVNVRDGRTVSADFKITPGYYLYRDKVAFEIASDVAQATGVTVANIAMQRGEMKHDANFGNMEVFHRSFPAEVSLQRTNKAAQTVKLDATYQGCSDAGLCYPPITKQFTLQLAAVDSITVDSLTSSVQPVKSPPSLTTAAPDVAIASEVQPNPGILIPADSVTQADNSANEQSQIAKLFKQGNYWLIIPFFFGAGLLLALTPCMFPMVPILSGIIVGRGHKITHAHGFFLSLAYVLGMALTYAAAGVIAGLSGELLSSALQTPWVLGSFAAVFVVLSFSMFGFYELQLPSALQNKLSDSSNHLHGGHLSGVFMMGALSAIIVSPCVAAPMAGALLYISQTGDAMLGAVALFTLAMGMGVPLLVIGASAGTLLPKAGAWMESVKRIFGVLMLAVAIWLIAPLIPLSVQMMLWAALLVLSSIYLGALDALPTHVSGWHKLWKGIGLLALLLGIAYLIGALSGARDMLRPLGGFGTGQAAAHTTLQFTRIKNIAELEGRIAQAGGKSVMLDFYADWCVSCKEMERFAFSDARVQAKLKNTLLLQADVTANNADDKALLKRFALFGPPAILFFDKAGREQGEQRVTGYQDTTRFLITLNNVTL